MPPTTGAFAVVSLLLVLAVSAANPAEGPVAPSRRRRRSTRRWPSRRAAPSPCQRAAIYRRRSTMPSRATSSRSSPARSIEDRSRCRRSPAPAGSSFAPAGDGDSSSGDTDRSVVRPALMPKLVASIRLGRSDRAGRASLPLRRARDPAGRGRLSLQPRRARVRRDLGGRAAAPRDRRPVLHPRGPAPRNSTRHGAQRRARRGDRLVRRRFQGSRGRLAGDRGLERARPLQDRQQLPRGRGREHHVRRGRSVDPRPRALRYRGPAQPRRQIPGLEGRRARVRGHRLDREEPVRAQERAARARRRQSLREQLGPGPDRLRDAS